VAAAVIDGRTLRLDDGRIVLLDGLAAPAPPASAAALRDIALGRPVVMRPIAAAQDRWGRVIAQVDLAGDTRSLEEALLRRGLTHVAAQTRTSCLAPLLAAEAAARRERLGVWAKSDYVLAAADAEVLARRIGDDVVAEGLVVSARAVRDRVYIDFARRGALGLAVVVRKRSWSLLGIAGEATAALRGKRLRVRGRLEWRGQPLIEASGAEQIERLEPVASR
jgi:hypothetical protein